MSQEVLLEKPHAPSEHSTRKRLTRGRFFEGLLNHMESENKKKIGLGRLNCTKDKVDRNGGNKTQIICRCCSNYLLSKLIVDNGFENLWRRENQDSSEFTCYDRSSGTSSRIDRVYTDIKMLAIPRLIPPVKKILEFQDQKKDYEIKRLRMIMKLNQ